MNEGYKLQAGDGDTVSLKDESCRAHAVFPVDEPVKQLAQFAFDWAQTLCGTSSCADYHRGWGVMRAWTADGGLPAGIADFLPAMTARARNGRIRVLLSGAADSGLASAMLACLRPAGIEPSFVLSDCCQTPLMQNMLFAQHARFALQTHHGRVEELTVAPVDVVLSHSFLGFIAPEKRAMTVAAWARNLRQGGAVLYSGPILGEGMVRPSTSTPEYLAAVAAKVVDNVRAAGGTDAEALAKAAVDFWAWRVPYTQPSEAEVLDLFAGAGLIPVDRRTQPHRKFNTVETTGREANDYRIRLNLVAERP